jgi:hypothetical protein
MRFMKRVVRVALVAGLAATTTACAPKTIGHVLADPAHYRDHAVKVQGRVVRSYSVLGQGAYQLRDGTGSLWIVSNRGVPHEGARVQVKGTVRDVFAIPVVPAGAGTVMEESSRKVKD